MPYKDIKQKRLCHQRYYRRHIDKIKRYRRSAAYKESQKRCYRKHRAKISQWHKHYYAVNREKILRKQKDWYARNNTLCLLKGKEYRLRNRCRINASSRLRNQSERRKEYNKRYDYEYRKRNADTLREKKRAYYLANRIRIRERIVRWKNENKERVDAWYAANRDRRNSALRAAYHADRTPIIYLARIFNAVSELTNNKQKQ